MAKQAVKKIRPITAIESLKLYNEKVLSLITMADLALHHNQIGEAVLEPFKQALIEVKEFYKD